MIYGSGSWERFHGEMNRHDGFKKFLVAMLVLLACRAFGKGDVITLQGVVEDSQCAFNVHARGRSHDLMLKAGVAGTSERDCTLYCVRMGGDYVLAIKDDVYRLDDQNRAEKFAGEKVKITATLVDAKTNTLHVISIEALH